MAPWRGIIRNKARKDRSLYGSGPIRENKPRPREKNPISFELKREILGLLFAIHGPKKTVSGLVQQIDRRLNESQSREAVIRRVLAEAAANGEIQLPPLTKRGSKKK